MVKWMLLLGCGTGFSFVFFGLYYYFISYNTILMFTAVSTDSIYSPATMRILLVHDAVVC